MHRTKIGDFKNLAVGIYLPDDDDYVILFCDTDAELTKWVAEKKVERPEESMVLFTFKDVNYLLDRMVKNKKNTIGKILYEVYDRNYPDSEHKEKVIQFWKEKSNS